MSEYSYIIEKIRDSEFGPVPFKHLYIEDFLSNEHLEMLITDQDICLPPQPGTDELFAAFEEHGYKPTPFPGCITDADEYIESFKTGKFNQPREILEAFGMAMKLERIRSKDIQRLIDFLNGSEFHGALKEKFGIRRRKTRVATAIQKYVSGYEISPHPDIRSKCLTYLININTSPEAEDLDIHTYLLDFKPEYQYIKQYWRTHPQSDRDWVPWGWCDVTRTLNRNNSLVMFAPSNDTLHAVKLKYDHCKFQRTQLYGNLWYKDVKPTLPKTTYKELEQMKAA